MFGRQKEKYYEEDPEDLEVDDLKPENRRKRKDLPKPWGKRERYTVLVFLLATRSFFASSYLNFLKSTTRTTGGFAFGAISTKSKDAFRAFSRAS